MRRFQSSTVNSVPSTSFARTCLYRRLGRRFGLDLKPVNGFVRQGLDDLLGLPDMADQPVGYVLPEPFGPLASQCLEREYLVRIRAEPDASSYRVGNRRIEPTVSRSSLPSTRIGMAPV